MSRAPSGVYPGEFTTPKNARYYQATGEFRPPKKGEYYLSGNPILAWDAPNDFGPNMAFWIAKKVDLKTCPLCSGRGQVVVKTLSLDPASH